MPDRQKVFLLFTPRQLAGPHAGWRISNLPADFLFLLPISYFLLPKSTIYRCINKSIFQMNHDFMKIRRDVERI